jgi:hypothetical protein
MTMYVNGPGGRLVRFGLYILPGWATVGYAYLEAVAKPATASKQGTINHL